MKIKMKSRQAMNIAAGDKDANFEKLD